MQQVHNINSLSWQFLSKFKDAHKFLILLINHINEIIVKEQGSGQSQSANNSNISRTKGWECTNLGQWTIPGLKHKPHINTFFSTWSVQWILTSKTQCLNCETVTRVMWSQYRCWPEHQCHKLSLQLLLHRNFVLEGKGNERRKEKFRITHTDMMNNINKK